VQNNDLIRRSDVLDNINKRRYHFGKTALDEAFKAVYKAPTIAAEPVRHGRWVDKSRTFTGILLPKTMCSVCNWFTYSAAGELFVRDHKYCPNCGAKMDGGDPND